MLQSCLYRIKFCICNMYIQACLFFLLLPPLPLLPSPSPPTHRGQHTVYSDTYTAVEDEKQRQLFHCPVQSTAHAQGNHKYAVYCLASFPGLHAGGLGESLARVNSAYSVTISLWFELIIYTMFSLYNIGMED